MKKQKLAKQVTHHEVQRALKRFLEHGGLIMRLPDQQNRDQPMVGGEKYQNFESLSNLLS